MDFALNLPSDLTNSAFAKQEAKWARSAAPYDNLSSLPPKAQTAIDNYYVKTTSRKAECVRSVLDYTDPWPVKRRKKQPEALPEQEFITAGIAADDREAFNQELDDFLREYDPENPMNTAELVAAKNERIAQVQRAVTRGQVRAAAKAQEEAMPSTAPVNPRITRSRIKKATDGSNECQASHAKEPQDTTAAQAASTTGATENSEERSTLASGTTNGDLLQSTPAVMPPLLMRNTRELSADHSRLSRPVRSVVSGSYYAANSQGNTTQSAQADEEPIKQDELDEARPAGGEPEENRPAGSNVQVDGTQEEMATAAMPVGDQPTGSHPGGRLSKGDEKKKAAPAKNPPKNTEEPKKRRAAQACDNCRKHKTRCMGGIPCEACVKRKFTCAYASDGKRAPGKGPLKTEGNEEDSRPEANPSKRACKEPAPAAKEKQQVPTIKAKQPTKSAKGKAPAANQAQEQSKAVETQPTKRHRASRGKGKEASEQTADAGEAQVAQPAKSQQSSGRRGKRTREGSEEVESQPAKRQRSGRGKDKGTLEQIKEEEAQPAQSAQPAQPARQQRATRGRAKRAREDSEDVEARPAKQQRKGPCVPWHILHSVVDKTASEGEKDLSTTPSFAFEHLDTREKVINSIQQEDVFHNRPSVRLVMPDLLKAMLVDDWEHITKDHQLVPLPHKQPVDQVLKDYLEDERLKREKGSTQMDILEETIAGLREYFDRTLGRILLYRFERLQYAEKRAEWEANAAAEKPEGPSTTYGAEHLCRLLVSLPELVGQTNMDQQSVSRLREEMTKFSNWLSKKSDKYFVRQYEDPGSEYITKARNA